MKKILIIASAVLMAIGCSPRNITSAYNTPEPIYMNDEADGSITVRAFGEGRNLYDAKTQARKNALRAVIFKGISVPGNAYLSRPLVTELNAQEKYEAFFNEFFKDHGPYEKFVSAWTAGQLPTETASAAVRHANPPLSEFSGPNSRPI